MELEIVGGAEDRMGIVARGVEHQPAAVAQSRSQHRVGEVSPRLFERADRVALGHRAAAQAGELRKDEPHPVTAFAAGAQLGHDLVVNR